MSDRQVLEQILDTVRDPELKVTAIRDRIANLLTDAGYAEEEEDEEEQVEDD